MSTCIWVDLDILGSHLIMLKNLLRDSDNVPISPLLISLKKLYIINKIK